MGTWDSEDLSTGQEPNRDMDEDEDEDANARRRITRSGEMGSGERKVVSVMSARVGIPRLARITYAEPFCLTAYG